MSTGEAPPPPPPAAAPLPDADGDGLPNVTEAAIDAGARYQARVAFITAMVALVSAILGPIVSLWINHAQINSQGDQFRNEIQANTGQSEAEFVRTQQSTAYADFLTAFNNATLDLIGAAGTFNSAQGGGAPPKVLAEQENKSVQAVKDVTAAYYKTRIVASKDSFDSSQALYAEFGTWSGTLLTIGSKVLGGQPLTADDEALLNGTNEEYQKLLSLSIAFIDDGRDDFSINEVEKQKDGQNS